MNHKVIDITSGISFIVYESFSKLQIECTINDKRFKSRYETVSGYNIEVFIDIINFSIDTSMKYRKEISIDSNIGPIVCAKYRNDEDVTLCIKTRDTVSNNYYGYESENIYTFSNMVASNMKEVQNFIEKIKTACSKVGELRLQFC